MNNKTLPILLKNQKILLIGGGNIAFQKAEVLFQNNIDFSIITKQANKKISKLSSDIKIKNFKIKDIKDHYIIIDATGNKKVLQKLINYKKNNDCLLNVVDNPKMCDFYFMALTTNSSLQVAVTSNGVSPIIAQKFRDKCQNLIPDDLEQYMEEVKVDRQKGLINKELINSNIDKYLKPNAYLVGCGVGDPELLTLKAYKCIQNVDVVLYDHLVSKEIMDLVPKNTEKIFVGKKQGFHTLAQEKINTLIYEQIQKGLNVARLKSGDPFIFGRGAEELSFLTNLGVKVEVIAGISSAISAPLMANIPITARDYANSFTVVSAHLKGHRINLDWIDLLNKTNHTTVVLMGLSRVEKIVNHALEMGIDSNLPTAIISNASRENQKVVITTLKQMPQDSKDMQSPAVLIFGDVVSFVKTLKVSK